MDSESSASTGTLIFAVVFYSACSSMMIIANKLSVKSLPYPSMVATIQLTFCMLVCLVIKFFGIRPVDQFVWAKVKPYMVRRAAALHARSRALHCAARRGAARPRAIYRHRSPPAPFTAHAARLLIPNPPSSPRRCTSSSSSSVSTAIFALSRVQTYVPLSRPRLSRAPWLGERAHPLPRDAVIAATPSSLSHLAALPPLTSLFAPPRTHTHTRA